MLLLDTSPMAKTRAIRLSDKDEKLIQEFLEANPFFDFSSLARTAIVSFIKEPKLHIKPIKSTDRPPPERGLT